MVGIDEAGGSYASDALAVMADVHGDLPSQQRVLAAIDRGVIEAIWCLGVIVGLGTTDPADVVDLLRARCALVLAGNHDRRVSGGLPLEMLPLPRQRAALRWQRDQLSAAQLVWLATFPSYIQCGGSRSGTEARQIRPPAGCPAMRTPPVTSRDSRRRSGSSGMRTAL
jgi:hypothetical protein